MINWRKIDSAKKSGEKILLATNEAICSGEWKTLPHNQEIGYWRTRGFDEDEPTHWSPLNDPFSKGEINWKPIEFAPKTGESFLLYPTDDLISFGEWSDFFQMWLVNCFEEKPTHFAECNLP